MSFMYHHKIQRRKDYGSKNSEQVYGSGKWNSSHSRQSKMEPGGLGW